MNRYIVNRDVTQTRRTLVLIYTDQARINGIYAIFTVNNFAEETTNLMCLKN